MGISLSGPGQDLGLIGLIGPSEPSTDDLHIIAYMP